MHCKQTANIAKNLREHISKIYVERSWAALFLNKAVCHEYVGESSLREMALYDSLYTLSRRSLLINLFLLYFNNILNSSVGKCLFRTRV